MRNAARFLSLAAAALLSSIALAQQDAQDFTLPEPTPTATPEPQGPVDDSGVVPIAPRVIPTSTPTPEPSDPAEEEADAEIQPRTLPGPIATATPGAALQPPAASPSPIAAAPAAQTLPAPSPPPNTSQVQDVVGQPDQPQDNNLSNLPALPTAPAETDLPSPAQDDPLPQWSDLPREAIIGGVLGLLAILAGLLIWKRRRVGDPVPEIERPEVAAPSDQPEAAATAPRFDISFEVEGVSRSLMAVMVTGRILVKNRGDRAVRDIKLLAELTSAHHPGAKTEGQLEEIASVERVGPHQTHREKVSFRLPLDQVQGMRRDGVPYFVPLVRVAGDAEGADPKRLDFVLGTLPPSAGNKLQPLPLNVPPGAYEYLRAHPIKR